MKPSRQRTRIKIVVISIAVIFILVGLSAHQSMAVLYNDGAEHTVNSESEYIKVEDSPLGYTTTINVIYPAIIGIEPPPPDAEEGYIGPSIILDAINGGEAIANILGGSLLSRIDSLDASRTNISNGIIGKDHLSFSLLAYSPYNYAQVAISDGTFEGGLYAGSNCNMEITGGSIGFNLIRQSVITNSNYPSMPASLDIVAGTFEGGLDIGDNSSVFIDNNAHVGIDMVGRSISVNAPDGRSWVHINNGTFEGGISARSNSCVSIDWGSIGFSMQRVSLSADPYAGTAFMNIKNGIFSGGISLSGNSWINIHDGSFGYYSTAHSVYAVGGSGLAQIKISKGTFDGGIYAGSNSWVRIDDGEYGFDSLKNSVYANADLRMALVDINAGTFKGGIGVGSNSSVNIADGIFGFNSEKESLSVSSNTGRARVDIIDGIFEGGIWVGENSHVNINAGSFGSGHELISVDTYIPSGSVGVAHVDIGNGTFTSGIYAGYNTCINIFDGSFGINLGLFESGYSSVYVNANEEESRVNIHGGIFESGVLAENNSRVRITGGSFGSLGSSPYDQSCNASVRANVPVGDGTAEVEITGGTFSDGFEAGRNGTINVYGINLQIASDILTGTLSDGTPINAQVCTFDNGQINLHSALIGYQIPPGQSWLVIGEGCCMEPPPEILAPEADCVGQIQYPQFAVELRAIDYLFPDNNGNLMPTDPCLVRLEKAFWDPEGGQFENTIPVRLDYFQLITTHAVKTGDDSNPTHLCLTLQNERYLKEPNANLGPSSTGIMTVDFKKMTYDLEVELYYDMRKGINGPRIYSGMETLIAQNVPWSPEAPEGAKITDGFYPGVSGEIILGIGLKGDIFDLSFGRIVMEGEFPQNIPPQITSSPVTKATEGQTYQYDVEASDPEGYTLSYSLTTSPDGMSIDSETGLIQWTPSSAQIGDRSVTVMATDDMGGEDTQSFIIAVANPDGEICDGLDNDDDGLIDEDLIRSCYNDCGEGQEICKYGQWTDCDAPLPQPEVCDGIDNDCDGFLGIDEVDADGDGYMVCEGDCDDTNPDIYPGNAKGTDILYNGDFVVQVDTDSPTGGVYLSALLTDSDSQIIEGWEVEFEIRDTENNLLVSVMAVTDPSGIAHVLQDLPVGVYNVNITFTGDDCFYSSSESSAAIAVYDPKGGFATGGGWYMAVDEVTGESSRANFGFNVKYKQEASTGKLEFQFQACGLNLNSKGIDWLVINETNAQFKGQGMINGMDGYFFRIIAKDFGEPGTGRDEFDIKIWHGDPDHTDSTLVHNSKNPLDGGNIVVHTNSRMRTCTEGLSLLSLLLSSNQSGNASLFGMPPYSLPPLRTSQILYNNVPYNNVTSYNIPLLGTSSFFRASIPVWNMSLFGMVPYSYASGYNSLGRHIDNRLASYYMPLSGMSSFGLLF